MQAMDDMALLREYATNHSEAAFEALVSRRGNFVYSAAMRQVRDTHLAEEITQAVFIILARKANRIRDGTILSGWLFRTTRFAALAQIRAAAKHRRLEKEMQMQPAIEETAPDPLWEQLSPLLDQALAQLGEKDRQALLLRFFENKSLAEVGSKLGTGENTAGKRVARALEKLHLFFQKRGVVLTTSIIAGAVSANAVQAAPAGIAASISTAAVAKGAAASGSTLALVKATLKLTAWAKAKLALATGGAALATIGLAMLANSLIGVKFHPIDLSRYYQLRNYDFPQSTSWSAAPWGWRTFDGVPFKLGGIIQVTGLGPARMRDERFYPPRVSAIAIGRKAEVLHLVHAASFNATDGTPIAELILHYAGGEERSIPILYGAQVRDWWHYPNPDDGAISDPDSNECWTGFHSEPDRGATLRLFHSRFKNPLPDQLITSIDFVSLFSRTAPILLALTVSTGDSDRVRGSVVLRGIDESVVRSVARARVVDAASGRSIPDVILRLRVFEPTRAPGPQGRYDTRNEYFFGEYRSDPQGRLIIELPAQGITRAILAMRAPGYTDATQQFEFAELRGDLILKLNRK